MCESGGGQFRAATGHGAVERSDDENGWHMQMVVVVLSTLLL